MNLSRGKRFWIIVTLQVAVIVGMVARKEAIILSGRTITLRTNPVDPHSLFRGDYARLSFDVHRMKADDWSPWPPKIGETIYAELRQDATSWLVVGPRSEIPSGMPADHVVLKGKIVSHYEWSGHEVLDLQDLSHPGWLQTQASTAPWNKNWMTRAPGVWMTGQRLNEGQTVYVYLTTYNGHDWNLSEVRESSSTRRNDFYAPELQRVLTGSLGPYKSERGINAEYGIESYFIPENKSYEYQRSGLEAEIVVDAKGDSVLRHVGPPKN